MNYQALSDEDLKNQLDETRRRLQEYEAALSHQDNSVDVKTMRAEMTLLNHLKMEAHRRGWRVD